MSEIKEVLRLWLRDDMGLRPIAEAAGVDRKTVRRYVDAAVAAGLARSGGEGQLTDELIGAVVEAVRPDRPNGHGAAWEACRAWLEHREQWFYEDLPMVEEVRWYNSVVGEVYTIESWAAFEDEAAFGAYRAKLGELKSDTEWEEARTTQDEWWEFLETRLVTDPPVEIGFRRG